MAYTVSQLANTVWGNARVHYLRVTADAATGTVVTGLESIFCCSYAPQSMSTAAGKFAINELAAGTAAGGTIGVTGVASGDEILLTVYGK